MTIPTKKVCFASGIFNILHPGHIRFLKYSKSIGDILIVGVLSDRLAGNYAQIHQKIRIECISNLACVDKVVLIDDEINNILEIINPDIIIKGHEFKNKDNEEDLYVKNKKKKLIFANDDIAFSTKELIKKEFFEPSFFYNPKDFIKRRKIKKNRLKQIIKNFKNLNTLVIGDSIIDQYIDTEVTGLSKEDSSLVVSPLSENKYIGGAAIVSAHSSSLGAKSNFISVHGNDDNGKFLVRELEASNVKYISFIDDTRPTTIKVRYRHQEKNIFRINYMSHHDISSSTENLIFKYISKNINSFDLIIFSDFSYGLITDKLIKKISTLAQKNEVMLFADSQSSSQIGKIGSFKNMMCITPTEHEARTALSNFNDGLVEISNKLINKTKSNNLILKLGADGLIIFSKTNNGFITDQIPSLNLNPKNISGAGDSFLIGLSLSIAQGANIWESALIGSLMAYIQVDQIGNTPINSDKLLKIIDLL